MARCRRIAKLNLKKRGNLGKGGTRARRRVRCSRAILLLALVWAMSTCSNVSHLGSHSSLTENWGGSPVIVRHSAPDHRHYRDGRKDTSTNHRRNRTAASLSRARYALVTVPTLKWLAHPRSVRFNLFTSSVVSCHVSVRAVSAWMVSTALDALLRWPVSQARR